MVERPYVLLSCGMSIDGYVDDAADERLLLSNDADFDRVDAVRAGCDAILVGAATVRQDNPRLLVRSAGPARRAGGPRRSAPTPVKVTVTGSCDLDPAARFFALGDVDKLVYCAAAVARTRRAERLGDVATVIDGGEPVDLRRVTADLHARGVRRLMVEGGGTMHTQFLTAGLADELQLVVAPFFVGDSRAPRFVGDGDVPVGPGPPGDAGRGAPDRRRGAAALRAVRPLRRGGLSSGTAVRQHPHAGAGRRPQRATAVPAARHRRRHGQRATGRAARARTGPAPRRPAPRRRAAPRRRRTARTPPRWSGPGWRSARPPPNAHAVTPSRGPQPPMFSGSVMASRASSISGASRSSDADEPAARAATTNVARCPASTTVEASTMPGQLRRASRPARISPSAGARGPGGTASVPRRSRRQATQHDQRRPPAATAAASARPPVRAVCRWDSTGDGTVSSTVTPTATSTICPAVRSSTTARTPRPTSPSSRPCRTARSTSPSTPPGSAALRNSAL